MPVLKGSVTLSRFIVDDSYALQRHRSRLHAGLSARKFEALDLASEDERTAGFVELEDNDATTFDGVDVSFGNTDIFTYRVDELKVHPSMLKGELDRWVKAFQAEHGRLPGRREKQEAKSQIRRGLRSRSPVVTKVYDVSWDMRRDELLIWTSSASATDEIQDVLEAAFAIKLRPAVPVVIAEQLDVSARVLIPTEALHVTKKAPNEVLDDDVADKAEVEQGRAREQLLRGKAYLGREFLTWLLWLSESGDPVLIHQNTSVTVLFTDALTLRGITGEIVEETVRGATAPYSSHIRGALDRGLLVHAARLRLQHGERVFQVTLDADRFVFRGGTLPALLSEEDDDRVCERLSLVEDLTTIVHRLLEAFLRVRGGQTWPEAVRGMKAWMAGDAREAA